GIVAPARRRHHGFARRACDCLALDHQWKPGAAIVTLLATRDELQERAKIVSASMPELLEALSGELQDVMRRELRSPEEKAKLTRKGGRCSDDGALLEFN